MLDQSIATATEVLQVQPGYNHPFQPRRQPNSSRQHVCQKRCRIADCESRNSRTNLRKRDRATCRALQHLQCIRERVFNGLASRRHSRLRYRNTERDVLDTPLCEHPRPGQVRLSNEQRPLAAQLALNIRPTRKPNCPTKARRQHAARIDSRVKRVIAMRDRCSFNEHHHRCPEAKLPNSSHVSYPCRYPQTCPSLKPLSMFYGR